MLLEALKEYEARASAAAAGKLPRVLAIVTGKGPLRDQFMQTIGEMQKNWKWVRCVSMWLEAEDYPVLLGSADLGVCLHSSSSALDLPMKVVDMFGCELPVCALNFACLGELVKDGTNGLIFNDASQLAEQLESLLTSFPESPRLSSLRESFSRTQKSSLPLSGTQESEWGTWEDNWSRVVRPLILRDVGREEGM